MTYYGALTKTGWLYEGNYQQWTEHIKPFLRLMGQYPHRDDCGILRCWSIRNPEVVIRIISNVSPELLKRAPIASYNDPDSLLLGLARIAKPFRFLDLPAEIRRMVYDYVIPENESLYVEDDGTFGEYCDPIFSVSKQVRAEALPLFFHNTTFQLLCDGSMDDDGRVQTQEVVNMTRLWIRRTVKDQCANLRKVEIHVWCEEGPETARVKLVHSPELGLQSDLPAEMEAETLTVFEKHITSMEAMRKTLGLQGESIIMAILSRPELWEEGLLRFDKSSDD